MSWEDEIHGAEPGIPRALVYLERAMNRSSKSKCVRDIEDAIEESGVDTTWRDLLERYDQGWSLNGLAEVAARLSEDLQNGTLKSEKQLTVRVTADGHSRDFRIHRQIILPTKVGEVLVLEVEDGYDVVLPVGAYVDLLRWTPGQSASEAKVLAKFRSDERRGRIEVREPFVFVACLDDGVTIGVNWA